jgi:hypothetical protein
MPGRVPGAGRALTGGLALGVAGLVGAADFVVVLPKVAVRAAGSAICMLVSSCGCSVSMPIAPITTSALTPNTASTDLVEPTVDRRQDVILVHSASIVPYATTRFMRRR